MSSLAHHGVKGQKWGVRRYQNPDGTRTELGKKQLKAIRLSRNEEGIRQVYRSLSDKDLNLLGYEKDEIEANRKDDFKDLGRRHTDYDQYNRVRYKNGDAVGYIAATGYQTAVGRGKKIVNILAIDLAVNSNYRGQGHSVELGKDIVRWFDRYGSKEYDRMEWYAKAENIASQKAAERSGFERRSKKEAAQGWVKYAYQRKSPFESATNDVKSKTSTNVRPVKKEPIDIDSVMDRGKLSVQDAHRCAKLADKVYSKAAEKEPAITNDITGIAKKNGFGMYGLEHRLKQPTSIAGKIGSDSKDDGVSFDESARGIKDAVRYTTVSDNGNFVKNYNKVKSELESKGYEEVRCKNFFEKYRAGEVQHKAVQTTYRTPDGYEFEVQFQTPESQAAKELKIPIYEERRKQGISAERAKQLENEMHKLAEKVPYPRGIGTIQSHNGIKHSSIGGNMNYIYGNTLVLGDSSYLEHHGTKGMKWGIRKYQNPDGSLTPAGRIHYGVQGATRATANAGKAIFRTGKTAGSKAVTAVKKTIASRKEKHLADRKAKASKNRESVLKNKDLFTSQELADLEKRFKVEDEMALSKMRRGQEVAKTIAAYGDAGVKILNAAQTGGKAVIAISQAMGNMDQLKENRNIREQAAENDMSFDDYKSYTKAKTESKINRDFKGQGPDPDIPVEPLQYDNPPGGGGGGGPHNPPGGGGGGGPHNPPGGGGGGGPHGENQNGVHKLTGTQQKKLLALRMKKTKSDEDSIGDVSEEDVKKYKQAAKDAETKAKTTQEYADNLKAQRDQLDTAIRNYKLPPVNDPNYDAAAAQLKAAHDRVSQLHDAHKQAQKEADASAVALARAQREAIASEYGGSKGKAIAKDMAKKMSDKEYEHAIKALDDQRNSDKSGFDRSVAKSYLKDVLNPKNIANRTIDKAAGKIADKAINKQREALAKQRDESREQMAKSFERSMKSGTLDAGKGIRDYYQREFGLHGAQLDKAVNNYMDSHSGKGSKKTLDLSGYYDKRTSELSKRSSEVSKRESDVAQREQSVSERETNVQTARKALREASDFLKTASDKVYNDSSVKEEQLHEINEHIRKMMSKRVVAHSAMENNMYIIENGFLLYGRSSYLEHHGIKGQRWGVRRFQNPDGTRTSAGKKRYEEVGNFKFKDSTGRTQKRYYARIENNGRRQSGWDHVGTTKRQAKAEAAAEALADEIEGLTPRLSDRDRKAYNADIKRASKEIGAANRYAYREMAKNERWVKSAIPKANRTGDTSEFLRRAAKSQRDVDYFNRYSVGDYKHEKSIERKSFAGEIVGSAVVGAGAGIASAISGPIGIGVAASGIAIRTGSVIVGNIAKNRYRDQSLRENKTRQDEYYARDRLDKVRAEKAKKDAREDERMLRRLEKIDRQEEAAAAGKGNDPWVHDEKTGQSYYKDPDKKKRRR